MSLPVTPPPESWQPAPVAQQSLAPMMSTPAVKQSCQDAKHSLTAQVRARMLSPCRGSGLSAQKQACFAATISSLTASAARKGTAWGLPVSFVACHGGQVDIMFGKVRKLKDKRVLAVFLEDMKMVKGIISKWDARIDAMLSDQSSGKENQGPVSFQTTLAEILKQATPPGAPVEAAPDGNGRRSGAEASQVTKAQKKRSHRHKKQKEAANQQPPDSSVPDCHRQGGLEAEYDQCKGEEWPASEEGEAVRTDRDRGREGGR